MNISRESLPVHRLLGPLQLELTFRDAGGDAELCCTKALKLVASAWGLSCQAIDDRRFQILDAGGGNVGLHWRREFAMALMALDQVEQVVICRESGRRGLQVVLVPAAQTRSTASSPATTTRGQTS